MADDYKTSWDPNDAQDHGGFWVHPDESVTCGCCVSNLPLVFAWIDDSPYGIAIVIRQPQTDEEVLATIAEMRNCMVECIYYGGTDKTVLRRMIAAGVSRQHAVALD